ncbi:MAG: disulfide bond formation protein B [Gammaproteobacteria bacterium]|jgi:disulfide bond formation protein DsbB|nr:disulfide bond formation protein B [Gammaproteobacteria bacterium]MDH5239505.1 disulfide bond formation protein B [Gammaproteobacteria bacterium]MDH5260149.1 disulfide bond formation protein B [Gammaproteobacteria bacterium]MDH5583672.1 disulfide bond formation protein B [Gammaproteobacteria bacterium]
MNLPNKRVLNFFGALTCAGMMGFALYAQHVMLLDPCPLCILQRIAVILLGIIFLTAALHNGGALSGRIYSALIALVAASGTGVAGWHVRLQNLPPSEVPSCGPGFEYMVENFPLQDALGMIFKGSGECAEVVWRLLGLSMPTWVVIGLLGLGSAGIWNNLRR